MWELDHKEGWAPNNWCFWTVVLEKTLESPLDSKIKPVNPKGNQSWIFIVRIDAEAETPTLWPPHMKSWLIGSEVKSLSRVWLFATPWTAARKASLSITNSWSLLNLTSIQSVMPSNHLILCHPLPLRLQYFPASGSFQMSHFFASGGQSIGLSASASVLQMNIQDWFPLGWTGWIFLQSKRLSRVFSNTIAQKHQFFSTQLSLQSNSHICTWERVSWTERRSILRETSPNIHWKN